MTEAQWLASTNPSPMFRVLDGKVSERQLRLFACAWWRSIEPHDDRHEMLALAVEREGTYEDPGMGETVDPAWLLRDCSANIQHRERGAAFLRDIVGNPFRPLPEDEVVPGRYVCERCRLSWQQDVWNATRCPCCFADHVRKYRQRDNWLTWQGGTIPRLAQAIYEDRAFDRMPILADALEEAGCDYEEILAHCRGWERCPECGGRSGGEQVYCQRSLHCTGWSPLRGAHVRGCHVVDLLLGPA